MAYNKDLQEDKEAVFDTVDNVSISLKVAAIVMNNTSVRSHTTINAAKTGYLNATELADYLVKKGMPFRSAHDVVGKAVVYAISKGIELNGLSLGELRQFSPDIAEDVFEALSIGQTLESKSQAGGTSPARVADALKAAREYLKSD
jgi:argininosuccinate lyase